MKEKSFLSKNILLELKKNIYLELLSFPLNNKVLLVKSSFFLFLLNSSEVVEGFLCDGAMFKLNIDLGVWACWAECAENMDEPITANWNEWWSWNWLALVSFVDKQFDFFSAWIKTNGSSVVKIRWFSLSLHFRQVNS